MDKKKVVKTINSVSNALIAILVAALIFFAGYFTYYFSLDESIRSLIWIKNKIDTSYYKDISEEDFLENTTGNLNELLDDYSEYYTLEEYDSVMNGLNGERIGLGISFLIDDGIKVFSVLGNSPAEKSGVKEGSYLVGFGESESDIKIASSYNEVQAFISSHSENENFCLAFSHDKSLNSAEYITLCRASFTENYVYYKSSTSAYRFGGENATVMEEYDGALPSLPEDTAYIKLTKFAGDATLQMEKCLSKFKEEGKTRLVLDLRNNGGGSISVLQGIASYFCKDATVSRPLILTAKYKDGDVDKYKAYSNSYYEYFDGETEIKVLANANTASASECLLGAMLDYNTISYSDITLSKLNGEATTYGKGIMQSFFSSLSGGIKLTTAQIYWPVSDKSIHGVGIREEDGTASIPVTSYITYGDEELSLYIASLNG